MLVLYSMYRCSETDNQSRPTTALLQRCVDHFISVSADPFPAYWFPHICDFSSLHFCIACCYLYLLLLRCLTIYLCEWRSIVLRCRNLVHLVTVVDVVC